jgi:protoheme IX farnesyltransferase
MQPREALTWALFLIVAGLVMSWFVHPYAFAADLVGTIAAAFFRKRVICVFPQGAIASCAPVLMGWFAVNIHFTMETALLCLLICAWLPLHVWSVMVSNRDDYIGAGVIFFPMNVTVRAAVSVLLVFALVLNVTAIWLYFAAGFATLYLLVALIMGAAMLYATVRLVSSHTSKDAWKLYKLSSFPYLGIIFVAMCLSVWL